MKRASLHRAVSRGSSPTASVELLKRRFVWGFSCVGILSLGIYAVWQASHGNWGDAKRDIVVIGLVGINLLIFSKTRNVVLASRVILALMLGLLLMLFVGGGMDGTGIFWFFTFPALAFLLTSRREGLAWIIALWAGVFGFLAAGTTLFSPRIALHLYLSFFALSSLVYIYATVDALIMKARAEQDAMMRDTNDRLRKEILDHRRSVKLLAARNDDLADAEEANLNILEDLNEEKAKLGHLAARSEALLAGLGEGVIAVDTDGRIIFMNHRAEALLGVSSRSMEGALLHERIHLQDESGREIPRARRPFQLALEQGVRQEAEDGFAYLRADGVPFPASITVNPFLLNGKVAGAIAVFRDITKEREIDKAKTEIISLASHQLRTPLTAINWHVEALLDSEKKKLKLTADQRKSLEAVYAGSRRMGELINALLNASRIELGTFIVEPRSTDIVALFREVAAEQQPTIAQKKIAFTADLAELPEIPVDQKLLWMVFQNLLSNAIKYTPEKGAITVHLRAAQAGQTFGRRTLARDAVCFSIADTGCGIPRRQQAQIFTKLFRADNVKSMATEGTGLGLYIVKSILQHSSGDIWFESEEGKGSTFFMTLPLTGMRKKEGTRRLS